MDKQLAWSNLLIFHEDLMNCNQQVHVKGKLCLWYKVVFGVYCKHDSRSLYLWVVAPKWPQISKNYKQMVKSPSGKNKAITEADNIHVRIWHSRPRLKWCFKILLKMWKEAIKRFWVHVVLEKLSCIVSGTPTFVHINENWIVFFYELRLFK